MKIRSKELKKSTSHNAVAIVWKNGPVSGSISVRNGQLGAVNITTGDGTVDGDRFSISSQGPCRVDVVIEDARVEPGSDQTLVAIRTDKHAFTFFLRDVCSLYPIIIPAYGVVISDAADTRDYAQIKRDISSRGLQTELEKIESEPEECWETAAAHTRPLTCQTWLGLSRDVRIFQVGVNDVAGYWGWVQPRFHAREVTLAELEGKGAWYDFTLGRGSGCEVDILRWIEDGTLPILHSTARDGDVVYSITSFVTTEWTVLTARKLRGTHFLVADGYAGALMTEDQKRKYEALLPAEVNREEETVLCFRAQAVNRAPAPRYAWFRAPCAPGAVHDEITGLRSFSSGRVFCIARLNGKPMPDSEMAVLVKPGESVLFEFFIPHSPVPRERALLLAQLDFDAKADECRAFWRTKLSSAAQISLPEKRVDEMVKAGLLHCDLVAYGLEPDGTLAPTIGWYPPIGTESLPIILFFDSMGWHNVARRACEYFLEKQHDDGFIQNVNYMVETGAALWGMAEHYRYTRDEAWVKRIASKLVKSCDFLIAWRRRNQRDDLKKHGYGMLDGNVGDPLDQTHYFFNSAYACAGIKGVAAMLALMDPAKATELIAEAHAFRQDIRVSLEERMAASPVIPLRDGTWRPTAPPWAEACGPVCLYVEKGAVFTHNSFTPRDSCVGPLWLVLLDLIDADEPITESLLQFHAELFTVRNVGFCQPFYSRHDFTHLKRGEVKAFLKTYYNGFASLADRETYTWWEHFFHASPHKTHEEAWFLMQTRWMLWLEEGDRLSFLRGVPRRWLEHSKVIELKNVASYFGPISLRVESRVDLGVVEATVECRSEWQPRVVSIRLPHPLGLKAMHIEGGVYCPEKETVVVEHFRDSAQVKAYY